MAQAVAPTYGQLQVQYAEPLPSDIEFNRLVKNLCGTAPGDFDPADYANDNFDTARAERVCDFIECLRVPSGIGAGEPFMLRSWQRKFIYDIFTPTDMMTRLRMVRRAILSIGRKNGKTALIAALVLVFVVGPEAVQNGEVYSAANDRDQAAQVFKFVSQIVKLSPELQSRLKVVDSTKTVLNTGENGSFYKAVSAEAGTKHGLNPVFVIYDELAQAKNRELYDVLDTSFGGREEPLFVTISTQSRDPKHILSELIDDGLNSADPMTVCHLYEVPLGDKHNVVDIFDERWWYFANPALDDFRSLADLRALAAKASRMPSEEPKFRNLYLNQRVSMIASLIARVEWDACSGGPDQLIDGEDVYAALDLAGVNDLCALSLVSKENGNRVAIFMWKPYDLLEEHSDRDFGKGNHHYVTWAKEGFLETTDGVTLDYDFIATRIGEIITQYNVVGLAYDRWRIKNLLQSFVRVDVSAQLYHEKNPSAKLQLIEWGQGYKDMSPAVDEFERAVLDRSLVHPDNPVLTFCVANAVVTSDPALNRKLDKDKAKFRIDGAVALCMALGYKRRDMEDNEESYLEKTGLIVL